MKAVLLCVASRLKRKTVPHLLLGLCVLLTAALCANAFTLRGQLNPAFDRAYAEMDGPHLCCLWNHETIPPDEVRAYMDGWRDRLTYQVTERTKTIDYMENGGAFSFVAAKSNGENIAGGLRPAVGTVLTVLLVAAVLLTVNLTFLLIRREQRQIGLLKAVGMTSGQIVKIYSWRNGLSALTGNSMGLALGIFALPKLLTPWARTLGLSAFPFSAPLAETAACFFLLPACMVLGTYAAARAIGRVPVRPLVSE